MSSLRRATAASLLEEIHGHDADATGDQLFLRLLEHHQVIADELAPRTYRFDQQGLATVRFAALTRGDVTFTFDRETALLREDFEFASMDHPLMRDALGFLLDSESGNASFAIEEAPDPPVLLLEAIFVLEAVAPANLHVDRFLPPTCLRVVIDQTGMESTAAANNLTGLEAGNSSWFRERLPDLRVALKRMLTRADDVAEGRASETRTRAAAELRERLGAEIERLRALAETNDNVRPEEVQFLEHELEELSQHLHTSRLRVEALRVVWRGPASEGVPQLS
jgi:ATP-dependent helicase HepA